MFSFSIKTIAIVIVLAILVEMCSFANDMLNRPSDVAVFLGVLTAAASALVALAVCNFILRLKIGHD